MRILFVIDYLGTGGAQRQMVNLALGLKYQGWEIEFFCYARGENMLALPLHEAGIPIHIFLKRSRYSFDVILALQKVIATGRYDLILSFLTTPNFYAIVASQLLAKRPRLVISERNIDLPQEFDRQKNIVRQLYRFADQVVVNNHYQGQILSDKYSWLQDRIKTIYNGYDLELFYPAAGEPDNPELQLLTIASVQARKNGLCLVESLAIARDKYHLYPKVHWVGQRVFTGEPYNYLLKMEQAISNYHLEAQWTWMDQRLDIVDLLHRHNVLVHPSYKEGLPNVVCEAMACGRPVIVSNTLEHPLLVQDGISGFLFDLQNPAHLAETISRFSKLSSDERHTMGLAGRKFAEQNLSMAKMTNQYESLFQAMLN